MSTAIPRLQRVHPRNAAGALANDGVPALAYGTGTALYQRDVVNQVSSAAAAGHRFFDLAEMYQNTASAGEGIRTFLASDQAKQAGVSRKDLTILTKIGEGQKRLYDAIKDEVAALKDVGEASTPPFDIILSHYPPRANKAKSRPSNVEAWRELERAVDDGLTRSIGVSNWLAHDIEEVYSAGPKHPIAFNQIEYHPLVANSEQYKALIPLCKEKGITIMVYSALVPLTRNLLPEMPALKEAIDKAVAAKPGRTQASVLLKYAHQQTNGGIIVSTSTKAARAAEYLSFFATSDAHEGVGADDKLSEDEVRAISRAGAAYGQHKAWMTEWW